MAPRVIPGFTIPSVNPLEVNIETFLRTQLDAKLPVGIYSNHESLQDYVDPTQILPGLELAFRSWMQGPVHGGGENGAHSRNDGLLSILKLLGGLTSIERDNIQSTTKATTRQDCTLKYDTVPLVHVEEKLADVADAIDDLREKFRWIPNLNNIHFIFGIAISTTKLVILRLTSQGMDNNPLFQTMLTSELGLIEAVVAIVHCASVLKYYTMNDLVLGGSSMSFNHWHSRPGGKHIKLAANGVQIKYDEQSMLRKMYYFYRANSNVPYLEHMVNAELPEDILCLTPLGVSYIPRTLDELFAALKCILTCLKGLHANGYYHTDLRWSNLVWVQGGEWCVIDCTNFVHVNDTDGLRTATNNCLPRYRADLSPWSVRHELYQIRQLILHLTSRSTFHDSEILTWTIGNNDSVDFLLNLVSARING